MKTTHKLITFAAAAALCAPALARESNNGFYVMPEIGILKFSNYCDSAGLSDLGLAITSCEDSEIGFGIAGGYWFNDLIAAELGARFGSGYNINLSGTASGNSVTATSETSYNSFSLGGRINYPIGTSGFGLTGKAGLHRWSLENEGRTSVGTGNVTLNTTVKDDGFDFYGGIGANYAFTKDILAQGEYTFYSYGGDIHDDPGHAFTGSVVWNF